MFIFFSDLGQFDDSNPLHFHVLLSIFKQLTGQKLDCPRYGSHWEQIGFQVNIVNNYCFYV